jgi:hypothetical protein
MGAPARPTILRLLRPSLTDVVFAGILLWSFIAADGGWGRLLRDADAGLHIRIGDIILQTGHIPTTDPFSFTRTGASWSATEWLRAVLFSNLNTYFGLKGIVFLLAGGNVLLAVVLTLCAANANSIHYRARPHQSWRSTARAIEEMTASLRDKMRPVSLWPVALLAFLVLVLEPAASPAISISSSSRSRLRIGTAPKWRAHAFYGERIVTDALKLMEGRPGWRGVLASYRIDAVLAPPGAPLTELPAGDKRWTLVDKDAAGLLFRKAE